MKLIDILILINAAIRIHKPIQRVRFTERIRWCINFKSTQISSPKSSFIGWKLTNHVIELNTFEPVPFKPTINYNDMYPNEKKARKKKEQALFRRKERESRRNRETKSRASANATGIRRIYDGGGKVEWWGAAIGGALSMSRGELGVVSASTEGESQSPIGQPVARLGLGIPVCE